MNRLQQTKSGSPEETEACGAALASWVKKTPDAPFFIALYGDLGVGKTAFVRGFASVFAPNAAVRSPTFALVNEYRGADCTLFHFDMYRIESEDDLDSIGFYDYWDRPGVCLVEWSEKIPYALPDAYLRVTIQKDDLSLPNSRTIDIQLINEDTL